ncbi:demethylmenaquinone methyltransferase [Rubritalea halochordaticola]|uniref:Demethylmenaquinone methyltransferase n=2 Tax=Rubritalea halochordaticola TaxID=714537 RepID=A0ABP9V9F9_9BACT
MTGGAECLTHMRTHFGKETRMELVDWCEDMCARARQTVRRYHGKQVEVINASALALPGQDASYDAVVSTFGLKTLSPDELLDFVREVKRVLKPGGSISLLEFSMPENAMVRFFFRLYVKIYVPFLGWLFLGNPDNYRMLWKYTREFGSCRRVVPLFESEGFEVQCRSSFFGSATHITGRIH